MKSRSAGADAQARGRETFRWLLKAILQGVGASIGAFAGLLLGIALFREASSSVVILAAACGAAGGFLTRALLRDPII